MSEVREGVENGEMPLDYGMAAVLYLFEFAMIKMGPCSFLQPAD